MKKILLIIMLFILIKLDISAQFKSSYYVVPDSTTHFGVSLPAGQIIFDLESNKLWRINTKTALTGAANSALDSISKTQLNASSSVLSDTSYNKVIIIRPNKADTSFIGTYALSRAAYIATAGDYIYVNAGVYTDTTTRTSGLAVDSVDYYFANGARVNKTINYKIFNNLTTCKRPTNVYGYGTFISKYTVYSYNSLSSNRRCVFEFDSIVTTNQSAIDFPSAGASVSGMGYANIKGNILMSSYGGIVNATNCSVENIDIDINEIYVTANTALNSYSRNVTLTANKVVSTATNCIYTNAIGASGYNYMYLFNIGTCSGGTNAYYIGGFDNVTINGYANSIRIATAASVTHNGNAFSVNQSGGYYKGNVYYYTCSGGRGDVTIVSTTYQPTQRGGEIYVSGTANVTATGYFQSGGSTLSGGTLTLVGNVILSQFGVTPIFAVSGGTLNINTDISASFTYPMITQTDGTIILNGKLKNTNATSGQSNCIKMTGVNSKLIINGGTLTTAYDSAYGIVTPVAPAKNIKIFSGGYNTNKANSLTGRRQTYKYTISSVDTCIVTLDDSIGGGETFQENDLGVYSTKALLAQRMAALINASGTLTLTAWQPSAGTDEYFYVTSDIISRPFTSTVPTSPINGNMSTTIITENHYALTNIVGGTIIQDTDVE